MISISISYNSSADNSATFPRHPTVSPDGSQVAFSYAGDIWSVSVKNSEARRITTNQNYEYNPHWSPDGNWIAFNADWSGDEDVYLVSSSGGQTIRLTWFDTKNHICDWTPDSKSIIFSSRRDLRYPDFSMIYSVSIDGGTPEQVFDAFGSMAAVNHSGNKIAYVRNGVHWWRKNYRGSKSGEIWIFNKTSGSYLSLADNPKKENGDHFRIPSAIWPLWANNEDIYFVSDTDSTKNLWKRTSDGNLIQITDYKQGGIRFPSISFDSRVIAFEHNLDIYLIENDLPPRKLNVQAPFDNQDLVSKRITYKSKADEILISDDEKELIVGVRGEIFAGRIVDEEFEKARGLANSITRDHFARDNDFTLSSGGDSLIFVSDRDGNRNLYLTFPEDESENELATARKFAIKQLTDTSEEEHDPIWSPDARYVGFVRGKGDLFIYDLKKDTEKQILSGWSLLKYCWSPDGEWIAYAREDDDYNSDIFVINVNDKVPVNVSRHPDEDDYPVWSKDGKKLGFRSRRRENNWDIYFVFLALEDHHLTQVDRDNEMFLASLKSKNDKKNRKDEKKEKEEAISVQVDTTDIFRRIREVAVTPGVEGNFAISPDGSNFAFTSDFEGKTDLYRIKWSGEDQIRLTKGGKRPKWFRFSANGKNVFYLDNSGKLRSITEKGKKTVPIPFEAICNIDYMAEREQKFLETWRGLDEKFYNENFHGQDWAALRDYYQPIILRASTEQDFADIMRMMMGELNASHMGYNSPRSGRKHSVGQLGLDFDNADANEGLLVKYVLPKGPCDRNGVFLKAGDRILEINSTEITDSVNIYQILDNQVNQPVELIVQSGKKKNQISVRPMNSRSIGMLRYDDWVTKERAVVDSISNGKLGYIHIRGMGRSSLVRFEAQLFSRGAGKDGLVIDVRNNGGGSITDQLLAMLQVKRHAVTYPRDGGPGYPQGRLPLYSWVKPIIVLCNQHSFSNAEIFSHAIKTLERGLLVGVPTPGGVISTGWEGLIDGSSYRVPLRGWYRGDKIGQDSERNMEGNGAVPDFIVELNPDQISAESDNQLITAIQELLKQLPADNE